MSDTAPAFDPDATWKYEVNIGIALTAAFGNGDEWDNINERVRKLELEFADAVSLGAGTGGGQRDIDTGFTTEDTAHGFLARVREEFGDKLVYETVQERHADD